MSGNTDGTLTTKLTEPEAPETTGGCPNVEQHRIVPDQPPAAASRLGGATAAAVPYSIYFNCTRI